MAKERKYTEEHLPILKEGIIETFDRDFQKRNSEGTLEDFFHEIKERIEETNPRYASHCQDVMDSYKNEKNLQTKSYERGILIGLLIGYELLRRQAETYDLSKNLDSKV